MASGGWFGKLLTNPLGAVGSLLGGGGEYTVPTPEVKASDLVQSTSSLQPNSPVMGDDTANSAKKKRGIASLYVNRNSGSTGGNIGRGGF